VAGLKKPTHWKRLGIPEDVWWAIEGICAYNWDAELEDYVECAYGSGNENGIFPRLVRLRNWLFGEDRTPESYIPDEDEDEDEDEELTP
jgi:hypothetical protein